MGGGETEEVRKARSYSARRTTRNEGGGGDGVLKGRTRFPIFIRHALGGVVRGDRGERNGGK